jgi:predicted MFS family arabinose efflux permease
MEENTTFTSYQRFVIGLLAITLFTVVLDFMVMAPLGDVMMKSLQISASQFGVAVSAYAFSAGISGLLTAGFADRFDRKKLLLFFYIGFAVGTLFCALAPNYPLLVLARIVTGIFGGVIGSIAMAIVADVFSLQQRGKVMGFVQMGFGGSQVLGVPVGLYIANAWGWHAPFLWIAVMAALIALTLFLVLKPVTEHLSLQQNKSALTHIWHTVAQSNYRLAFLNTALLSIGGFMMMPFSSAFAINNVKVTVAQLPFLFMVSGVASLIAMPLIGRFSDRINKFNLFAIATLTAIMVITIYTHFSETPFWIVLVINVAMMISILSRMIPAMALVSAIPQPQDRGAFMSINSSLQQIAGGLGAMLAGVVVVQKNSFSPLEHYDVLGYVTAAIMLIPIYLVYRIQKIVVKK